MSVLFLLPVSSLIMFGYSPPQIEVRMASLCTIYSNILRIENWRTWSAQTIDVQYLSLLVTVGRHGSDGSKYEGKSDENFK